MGVGTANTSGYWNPVGVKRNFKNLGRIQAELERLIEVQEGPIRVERGNQY